MLDPARAARPSVGSTSSSILALDSGGKYRVDIFLAHRFAERAVDELRRRAASARVLPAGPPSSLLRNSNRASTKRFDR